MATRTPSGAATSSNDYALSYSYNLVNAVTVASSAGGQTLTYAYDALGRVTSEMQPFGSITYQYDAAGDRTRITWGDGFYAGYAYDMIGEVTSIAANGATSGVGVLASYSYDNQGRRTAVTYGNGTGRAYSYDAVSRLVSLQLTFPAASNYNETIAIPTNCTYESNSSAACYTPSSQTATVTRSNDAYAWAGAYNVSRPYVTNGLNQYTSSGGVSLSYDPRGDLTTSGSSTYTYDKLNDLASVPAAGVSIYYDPLSRVTEYDTTASTRFYFSGGMPVAEVSYPSVTITQRYVPGAGTDEVVAWYQGSGNTTTPQFLQADERGSVIAVSNSAGGVVGVNSYDEFGVPASGNISRFGYTGQTWFPEAGLYNYKARWYSPSLGRFMQSDPIGYGDGLNWYNYAHGDPINGADPSGLDGVDPITVNAILGGPADPIADIATVATAVLDAFAFGLFGGAAPPPPPSVQATQYSATSGNDIIVSGTRTPVLNFDTTSLALSNASFTAISVNFSQTPIDHTQCPPGTSADTSGKPLFKGLATEYGVNSNGSATQFVGRLTKSGSVFGPGYTAATQQGAVGLYQTLKNTSVLVTLADNPSSTVSVVVNDTGKLVPGGVIDLSAAAMKTLTGKAYNTQPVSVYRCK